MSEATKSHNKTRYRVYFWLMDFSLLAAIFGWGDQIIDNIFGYSVTHMPVPWVILIAVPLWLFSFAVPLFLMVAKFMRDEYAEQLWRRTLIVLAYVVGVVPIGLYAAMWIAYLVFGQEEAGAFTFLFREADLMTYLQYSWMWFMVLFVCIFQFLRWRDSR